MSAWYLPGESAVVVGHRAIVMASADRAAALSGLLDRPLAPLGVLSLLSGGDVANLPDFAAVVMDDEDLVAMVRGPYVITCGDREWTGDDAATWREHRITGDTVDEVVVRHSNSSGDLRLPVGTGVVLAAEVSWTPVSSPEQGAPASPSPSPAVDDSTLIEVDDGFEEDDKFDEMVGATIHGHRVPDEATRQPVAPPGEEADKPTPPPADVDEPPPGDHDGRTITAEQLQHLRERRSSPEPPAPPGGVNATLAMSGGETVSLVQPVVIGRSPRAAQLSSAELPHLIVVDDPYVSGTHLEVALDGDSVIAIDRSTNGTVMTRPGAEPERLTKDEPTVLVDGCVLGLSDEITATVAIEGDRR